MMHTGLAWWRTVGEQTHAVGGGRQNPRVAQGGGWAGALMVGITRVPAGAAEAISPQLGKLRASASSRILGTRKARLAVGVPTATVVGAIAEGTLWAHHPLVTAVNLLATAL